MTITAVNPNVTLLSESARPIIEATLPVVGAHLGQITQVFYNNLFSDVPSLKTDLFNSTNQENGDQQKALAGAVAQFAGLLLSGSTTPIDTIMARIAAKHASLGVVPVQYDLVHSALFRAIVEVLGDAVTDDVAAAWDEVYWIMANSLIKQEAAAYEKAGITPGRVWTALTVIDKIEEAPGVYSFTLSGRPELPTPSFEPGQYISVSVLYGDGSRQIRQYTLNNGELGNSWRFTVKAVEGGRVSTKLIRDINIGYNLVVSIPSGSSYLQEGDDPIVLASSGVGSTLSLSILQKLVRDRDTRSVRVVHVEESSQGHAHAEEMKMLVAALRNGSLETIYTSDQEAALRKIASESWPDSSQVYVCGNTPFMRSVRNTAISKGIDVDHVHYEAFTPGSWLGFDN